jgi:TetR/AcrR family transcriptional repressor of nem operon
MTPRPARDPDATRLALLEAGLTVAASTGLAKMSVNRLIAEAGSSKGAFFHHFPDRAAYLVALHRHFHDRLMAEVQTAVGSLPPGRERLLRAATAYLDTFLANRGMRRLLLDARAEPLILDEVSRRNDLVARAIAADLDAMAWPDPFPAARLWVAMVAETSLVEFERGGRNEATRAALASFLDRRDPLTPPTR